MEPRDAALHRQGRYGAPHRVRPARAAQTIALGICGHLGGAGRGGAGPGVRLGPYRGVPYHRAVLVAPAYGYPRRLGGGLAAQPRVGPEETVVRVRTMAGQRPRTGGPALGPA